MLETLDSTIHSLEYPFSHSESGGQNHLLAYNPSNNLPQSAGGHYTSSILASLFLCKKM